MASFDPMDVESDDEFGDDLSLGRGLTDFQKAPLELVAYMSSDWPAALSGMTRDSQLRRPISNTNLRRQTHVSLSEAAERWQRVDRPPAEEGV